MYIILYLSRPQSASAVGACRSDFPSLVDWVWGKTDLPKVLCFMNKCSVESNARNWLANRYQLATHNDHATVTKTYGDGLCSGKLQATPRLPHGWSDQWDLLAYIRLRRDLPKPEADDGGGSSDST